jgi:PilZ domain
MEASTPPAAGRKALFDGRLEKRSVLVVTVYLAATKEPRSSERAVTRNVSPHGARLVTKRFWQAGDEPLVTPLTGDFPQMARVIYCQPRPKGGFYVGVQFPDHSIRWNGSSAR